MMKIKKQTPLTVLALHPYILLKSQIFRCNKEMWHSGGYSPVSAPGERGIDECTVVYDFDMRRQQHRHIEYLNAVIFSTIQTSIPSHIASNCLANSRPEIPLSLRQHASGA